ncbi:MAG: HDIG domain-containing protein [Candidatus Tectomicrobia bacterium]|uniref:HDIG domain-containing protein n=1 Tax=Tectimicrobiota bacterium TaxID=2528274 RepID=A0A932FUP7_UNCTE|nr:HDIG domain-containing protein [Candidatus Tectomicrobia bacterium]
MNREGAFNLLQNYLKNPVLLKHCLASEAIMRALAERLGEDPEVWGIVGLIHDLDFEETKDTPEHHTLKAAEILEREGYPAERIEAIKAHNAEALGISREGRLAVALACAETITGLIVATALVMPDKKLASVKVKSIMKRMKEPAFARNVNREIIQECQQLGLSLEEFVSLSLNAMLSISQELEL